MYTGIWNLLKPYSIPEAIKMKKIKLNIILLIRLYE